MSGYRSAIRNVEVRFANGQIDMDRALVWRSEWDLLMAELESRKKRILLLEERVGELEAFVKI